MWPEDLLLAWLRSGGKASEEDDPDPIGGDDYVARTIADAIEAGEPVRWSVRLKGSGPD